MWSALLNHKNPEGVPGTESWLFKVSSHDNQIQDCFWNAGLVWMEGPNLRKIKMHFHIYVLYTLYHGHCLSGVRLPSVPSGSRWVTVESVSWMGPAVQWPTRRVKEGRREIMSDHDGPTTAQGPPCRWANTATNGRAGWTITRWMEAN